MAVELTDSDTVAMRILRGDHDSGLGTILTAIYGRLGDQSDDTTVGVSWTLTIPEGVYRGRKGPLVVAEDDLSLRELELLEQFSGVGLVELNMLFTPSNLRGRVVAGLIRAALMCRHGLSVADADRVLAELPASNLVDWVKWHSVADDPKGVSVA